MAIILLIDNLEDDRETIRKMLERGNYEVLEASNGKEGLKIIDEHTPDVVVTDILMPEMDGFETIKSIVRIKPGLPVIAITGCLDTPYLEVALKLGAVYGLHKPFKQAELLSFVAKALQKDDRFAIKCLSNSDSGITKKIKNQKPILLIEDDRVDVMVVQRAFRDADVTNRLIDVKGGREALEFLRDEKNEKPCIILLDLNMPKMNGIEFLKIRKRDRKLKTIPVIVLTTSKQEQDVAECFKLNIAGYIVKPIDYLQFVEAIRTIDLYWSLSELPE